MYLKSKHSNALVVRRYAKVVTDTVTNVNIYCSHVQKKNHHLNDDINILNSINN